MFSKRIWITGAAVALVGMLTTPLQADGGKHNALCQRVCADGIKTCNCTPFEVEVEFCHAEEVEVSVSVSAGGMYPTSGGSGGFSTTVTAGTGQSSSACSKAKVPPGQCVWMRYCFMCCPEKGWFGGLSWECFPSGNSVQSSPATPEDCGTP